MQFLALYRSKSSNFEEPCIFCNSDTVKSTIKSHNIQRGNLLKRLSRKIKVYVLTDSKTDLSNFNISLELKGINKVTIFKCLYNEHDSEVFRNIETVPYKGLDD